MYVSPNVKSKKELTFKLSQGEVASFTALALAELNLPSQLTCPIAKWEPWEWEIVGDLGGGFCMLESPTGYVIAAEGDVLPFVGYEYGRYNA
jgi:hypothetical protein